MLEDAKNNKKIIAWSERGEAHWKVPVRRSMFFVASEFGCGQSEALWW